MRPDEAVGIPLVSLAEDNLALGDDLVGPAVVQDLGSEQSDGGVMMLGVVPGEEALAEAAGILDGAETIWELRTVLQGFGPLLSKLAAGHKLGHGIQST